MDTELIAAVVGIVALVVIGAGKAVRAIRRWRVQRELEQVRQERAMGDIEHARDRLIEMRRSARAAHPVVHRWDSRRGRDGGEAA